MKTIFVLATSLVLFILSVTPVQAGTVKVEWHEPDEYTDIKPANMSKKSFRASVFKQLEKHWSKMATKKLPEGMKLEVKVTNLNLAGDVRYNFAMNRDIRLVKNIYWPAIEFEYKLYDGKRLVKSETVKIKDMAFLDRGGLLGNRGNYYHEKRIITDWFVDDLELMLAQWKKQQSAVMS